jgi:ribonuclease D
MALRLITRQDALATLVGELSAGAWIALDTEFLRVDTYYPKLCLIQLATDTAIACVDTLALDTLAPLFAAIRRASQPKILHAARQDLEVLTQAGAALPAPLFDTQVAAALAGYDEQIGYGALVEALAGIKLGKQHTRTDWSKRPLSEEQLAYAEDDVRYLGTLHDLLRDRLAALGRLSWLEEECAALVEPALYRADPEDAWRRLGQGAELPVAAQSVLRALAVWRERAAQTRNLPRGWVLKDAVLVELARRPPRDLAQLATVEGVAPGAVRKWGDDILAAIRAALEAPPQRCYTPPARLDAGQQALYQKLAARVQETAAKLGLRPAVLATRQDLLALMLGGNGRLTRGWRHEVIGAELLSRFAAAPPAS